jgi:hypothetical protein
MKLFLLSIVLFLLVGCEKDLYIEVPRKYVGVKQMSTGFEMENKKLKFYTSGTLVNLGKIDRTTEHRNKLILVEVGMYTKKEEFLKLSDDKDHRITLGNDAPVTTDVRFRVSLSRKDLNHITQILAEMESVVDSNAGYEYITLMSVYDTYGGMDCRTGTRNVFAGFKDYETINNKENRELLGKQLYAMADTIFQNNAVPLTLVNVAASNIQQDKKIVAEKNQLVSVSLETAKIDSIGKACKRNGISFETYYRLNKTQEMVNKIAESGQTASWIYGLPDMQLTKSLKR